MSELLVALQFALLGALAAGAAPAFLQGTVPVGAWAAAAAGVALGLWALASNRPGNFNIRPLPRVGGQLIEAGPYRWIRHPMYTAVLLVALSCAWAGPWALAWFGLVALAVVLLVKAGLEERWMRAAHPAYAEYQARTRRFIPGVY